MHRSRTFSGASRFATCMFSYFTFLSFRWIVHVINLRLPVYLLTRPQSSSCSTRQRARWKSRGWWEGGEGEKTSSSSFVFSLPISSCAPFLGTHLSLRWYILYKDDWGRVRYTSFQNSRHFSILLFTCKLAPVASLKAGKHSFAFRV